MVTRNCVCSDILLTQDYQFCPRCGRRSGFLAEIPPLRVRLQPGQSDVSVPLSNIGPGNLPFTCVIDSPHLQFIGEGGGVLPGGAERAVRLSVRPDAPARFSAVLKVYPRDGAREHWWDTDGGREVVIPLNVERQSAAVLDIPTKTLLFMASAPDQRLYLHNRGDEPAHVILQAPAGFTLRATEDNTEGQRALTLDLPGRSAASVWVMRGRDAPAQPEPLAVLCGGETTSVGLRQLQAATRSLFKPDYVVGIDFGTVNTSIRLRHVAEDRVEPVGEGRFPSLMFVYPDDPQASLVGNEAMQAWNDPNAPDEAFLVESIKTLARLEQEPYAERYDSDDWSTANLLTLYLKALRRIIDEHFREQQLRDESNVLYVFTLPVLDAGPGYDRQEKRMRAAAARAGFPDDPGLVWTVPEPVSAALYLAHNLPDFAAEGTIPAGIAPGARICVVDAGGGTTDVCIGKLNLDERNRWRFETENAFALNHEPGEATDFFYYSLYPPQQTRRTQPLDPEVGGKLIDYELGYRSTPEGKEGAAEETRAHFPSRPWAHLFPMYRGEAEVLGVIKYLRGITRIKEELSGAPAQTLSLVGRNASGEFSYETLFEISREAVDEKLFARYDPTCTYREDLQPIVKSVWDQPGMGEKLRHELSRSGGVDFVFLIGGSTLIPEFEKQVARFTGKEPIRLKPPQRMSAVGEGAVWGYDASPRGVLPMDVQLRLHMGGDVMERKLLPAFQPFAGMKPFNQNFDLAPDEEFTAELIANGAAPPFPLARIAVREAAEGSLRVSVTAPENRGILFCLVRPSEEATLVWEVTL